MRRPDDIYQTVMLLRGMKLLDPWLPAGNVSVRTQQDGRWITERGLNLYRFARRDQVVLIHDEKSSTESQMHAVVHDFWADDYLTVVHLHTPYATAVACGPDLNLPPMHYYQAKLNPDLEIPIVRYETPGSIELAIAVRDILGIYPLTKAVLLRNHGMLVWDKTPEKAAENAYILEMLCHNYLLAPPHGHTLEVTLHGPDLERLFRNYP